MAKYFALLSLFFAMGCSQSPTALFSINVHQNGQTYRSDNGPIVLKRAPFSLIFSFNNIPANADTLVELKYWATDQEEYYDKLRTAISLDSALNHMGGTNVHAAYNNDQSLTLNMQNGYSKIYINKRGSTGSISHTFSNVERHDQRLDAWYQLSQFYQVPKRAHVKLEDLEHDHFMFYFSLRGSLPGPVGELDGRFVDIKFE